MLQPPIVITMPLSGTLINFELDTGATVTVMSEQNFCEHFSHLTLKPSSLRLKTYTGEALRVVGEADLEVSHGNQGPKTLTLAVVAGNGPPLLGRNWLQH